MSRKGCVVNLHVKLKVLVEAIVAQEAYHRGSVIIILVFGGLHGLGFNIEGALETLFPSIVSCQGKHHGQVLDLPLHVGVEQGEIAFTAAPEDITLSAESNGGINGVLQLYGHIRQHIEIRVGGSAVHVTRVAEDVCSTPEQLHAGLFLPRFYLRNKFVKTLLYLKDRAVTHEVRVMEAVEWSSDLFNELKSHVELGLDAVIAFQIVVRKVSGLCSEGIGAVTAE